jgi:uncharacterized damage-inducible protein DinB
MTSWKAHLEDLARHMEWADAALWRAVLASEPARLDARVTLWLYHIHVVQRAFTSIWKGEAPNFPEPSAFADPSLIAEWGRNGHRGVQAFLETVTPEMLDATIRVPWREEVARLVGGDVGDPTLGETIMQLMLHSVHHRAQVNARLRDLGGEPPVIDYIAWIWLGRPQAAWQLGAADDGITRAAAS